MHWNIHKKKFLLSQSKTTSNCKEFLMLENLKLQLWHWQIQSADTGARTLVFWNLSTFIDKAERKKVFCSHLVKRISKIVLLWPQKGFQQHQDNAECSMRYRHSGIPVWSQSFYAIFVFETTEIPKCTAKVRTVHSGQCQNAVGKNEVKRKSLVNPWKVLMPILYIKLGLS